MLARLQKSMKEKDQGFTLIELLVVIVIIGILAAIAIPLFMSQRDKGYEASIKSDLKSIATAQETYYVDEGAYAASTAGLGTDFTASEFNTITVDGTTAGSFCAEGVSSKLTGVTWSYNSAAGGLTEGACPTL